MPGVGSLECQEWGHLNARGVVTECQGWGHLNARGVVT